MVVAGFAWRKKALKNAMVIVVENLQKNIAEISNVMLLFVLIVNLMKFSINACINSTSIGLVTHKITIFQFMFSSFIASNETKFCHSVC